MLQEIAITPATVVVVALVAAWAAWAILRLARRGLCDCADKCGGCSGGCGGCGGGDTCSCGTHGERTGCAHACSHGTCQGCPAVLPLHRKGCDEGRS